MSRILAGVLAGCLVLAMAGVAGAGIPDPDQSSVALDTGGLSTCPQGDGPAFQYVTVTAKRADSTPIQGIPSSSFFFSVTGGDVTFNAVDSETDTNGEIRFEVVGDEAIGYPTVLAISCQIYTVVLNDSDNLSCITYDYDLDGDVDPVDFGTFAGDFGAVAPRSDFDWSGGNIDPIDFGSFAGHFGHTN
jgi:hypothetical protein